MIDLIAAITLLVELPEACAVRPDHPAPVFGAQAPGWKGGAFGAAGRQALESGDFDLARAAFARQRQIGHERADAALDLADLFGREGDARCASAWLDQAALEGQEHLEFFALQRPGIQASMARPAFAARHFPRLGEGASRAEAWRADLAFMERRVIETHIDPFAYVTPAQWRSGIAELSARADTDSDAQMAVGVMALMAKLGDGHSFAFQPNGQDLFGVVETPPFFTRLPLHLYWFQDQLRVIAGRGEAEALVGARVTAIGGVDIQTAARRIEAVTAVDNAMGHLWLGPSIMTAPEVLAALGLAPAAGPVSLDVVFDDGRRTRAVLNGDVYDGANLGRLATAPGYAAITPETGTPAYIAASTAPFSLNWLSDARILIAQVNSVADTPELSFSGFADQLSAALEGRRPDALILDLRHNSGGDSTLNPALVTAIASSELNGHGRIYTVIGRRTFSAAINLVSDMKRFTDTRLVGEPTGSSPNFIGETNGVLLPNTGMILSASSRRHQGLLSDAADIWWAPDLAAPLSWRAYREGRDPALEAVIEDRLAR